MRPAPRAANRPPSTAATCAARRARLDGVRHALDAADKGRADLQKTKNLRAVQLLLGHNKSTVRNLGVDVHDALDISEQTEI
jgi:hypothetical protein